MALRPFVAFSKEVGFRIFSPRDTVPRPALLLVCRMSNSAHGGVSASGGVSHGFAKLGQAASSFRFSWQHKLRQSLSNVNNKLDIISKLFAKQCNAIAALRIRRAVQIATLYSKLGYDKRTVKSVIERLGSSLFRCAKDRRLGVLLGAVLFQWDSEHITNEEMKEVSAEMSDLDWNTKGGEVHIKDAKIKKEWEKVIDKKHLVGWRKPVPNHPYLYEYKVFGTYKDLPGRAFFNAQLDLDFRKEWDKLIIKLEVVDADKDSDCEVVQWIMHYPFPMWSREYVYLRKHMVDKENNVMIIKSRSIEHPCCPLQDKYVRVNTYMSQWVIRPHTTFDENGFDYILTYYDDPQAAFPSPAYNYMARTGVPDFVGKMHDAAKALHEKRKGVYSINHSKYSDSAQNRETVPM